MAIIGNNSVGVVEFTNFANTQPHNLQDNSPETYTATADQEVYRVGFYNGSYAGTVDGVEVAVYDVTSGAASAPIVAGTATTMGTLATGGAWTIVELGAAVPLTEGNTYAVAWRSSSSTAVSPYFTYTTGQTSNSSLAGSSAFASTWTDNAGEGRVYSVYAETRTATGGRSITNIDADDDVQAGQTSVTITTVGLDASPSTQTATLGGETLTVNSWSATAVNVDIPLHIDLEWGSTTNQLALTDDTGTVTLNNVTLSAPTGWETVTYNGSAPNPATTESFYEYAQTDVEVGSFTMATNDILAWETQTGLTVDVQTIPIVDPPATVSGAYKIWDESLSTWTSVSSFTITDGGAFGGDSIPVDSRSSVFKIAAYLRSTGNYTAKQTNELVVEWLVDEGTARSNLNDMLYTYLGTLGLTGTLDDRLSKWQDL